MNGAKEAAELSKNKNITALFLDVKSKKLDNNLIKVLKNIDSMFYFASTKIFFRRTKKFHKDYEKNFLDIYVDSFYYYLSNIQKINKNFKYCLYPSTTEIENKKSSNIEYINSKKVAEDLCNKLNKKYPNLRLYNPRLKKITTHQTQGFNNNYDLSNDVRYIKKILDVLYHEK